MQKKTVRWKYAKRIGHPCHTRDPWKEEERPRLEEKEDRATMEGIGCDGLRRRRWEAGTKRPQVGWIGAREGRGGKGQPGLTLFRLSGTR